MSLEVFKYERQWIEGLNPGDVSPTDERFAPDCTIHMAGAREPDLSVSAFKELVTGLLTAFPNFHVAVEDRMVSGSKVAFRWVAAGKHDGPRGETQPPGQTVRFEGLIFDHVVGDQVVERWEQWDQRGCCNSSVSSDERQSMAVSAGNQG